MTQHTHTLPALSLVAVMNLHNMRQKNSTVIHTSFKNDSLTLVLYDGGL